MKIQIEDIIRETEKELKQMEKKLKTKDEPLKADAIKTVKAMAYEKILSVVKANANSKKI